MRFVKMHGCGNDYVFIDAWEQSLPDDLPALARAVSDRHRGVGGDGLIVIGPPLAAGQARMRMWNADGSEAEMCGNGIRCAAKLAWDHGRLAGERAPLIETAAGLRRVELLFAEERCVGARVLMGRPRLLAEEVPVAAAGWAPLVEVAGLELRCVGMGNPHAVAIVDDCERLPVAELGPRIERDPRFPRRANVEFTARLPDEDGWPVIRQRTWERGSGLTLACGTGACAALVAWVLAGRLPERRAILRLDGGDLRVAWPADEAEVVMEGEAVTVFTGEWPD
ncbi:MAG: diaminopimelate epimerase [Planctomycetota bacterium]|nr:diaminopimelate epimerase [Planctomycetota bacterium]MCX8039111.1 diaminopimelate epimerase [Planctomycetota bacterium]